VIDWAHEVTIAFQKEWARINNEKAFRRSTFSPRAIHRARAELAAMGFIELRKDVERHQWVRICPGYHILSAELLAALTPPVWPVEASAEASSECQRGTGLAQKSDRVGTNPSKKTDREPNADNGLRADSSAPIENLNEKTVTFGNMLDPTVPVRSDSDHGQQHMRATPNFVVVNGAIASGVTPSTDTLPAKSLASAPALLEDGHQGGVCDWDPEEDLTPAPEAPVSHQEQAYQVPETPEDTVRAREVEEVPAAAPELSTGHQVEHMTTPPAQQNDHQAELTHDDHDAQAEALKRAQQAAKSAERRAKAQQQAQRKAERNCPAPQVKVQDRSYLTPEQAANAAILQAQGVSERQAARLAKSKGLEVIARAIEDLDWQRDRVGNPGGWLNDGLTSGRYDQPSPATSTAATSTGIIEGSEADQARAREDRRNHGRNAQPAPPPTAQEREEALRLARERTANAVAPGAERAALEVKIAKTWFETSWQKAPESKRQEKIEQAIGLWRGALAPTEDQLRLAMIGHFMATERFQVEFARCYPSS
jgi:hypothetical protein